MLPIKYITSYPSNFFIDDLFDNFWDIKFVENSLIKIPTYDIIETDKEYIVELTLAGLNKEDISINTEKDVLTIKAERKEVKNLKYNRKESYFGKFERAFKLPEDIDKENIKASLENGILKVVITKLEENNKPSKKSIEIK